MVASRTTTTALLLAAGSGRRLGGHPKAWLRQGQRSLLRQTLEIVAPCCIHVVIATRREFHRRSEEVAHSYQASCVLGGSDRFASIHSALLLAKTEHVLICDVARPNLTRALIESLQSAIGRADGAAPVVRLQLRESLALLTGRRFQAVLPREGMALTQTPQLFRRTALEQVFKKRRRTGGNEVSLVGLCLKLGLSVVAVPGHPHNVKITYPEDLELFGYVVD